MRLRAFRGDISRPSASTTLPLPHAALIQVALIQPVFFAILNFAFAACLFCIFAHSALAQPAIPILVYHRFSPVKSGPTTITVQAFERQLDWLQEHNYKVVPLQDVTEWKQTSPAVAITVDDGNESDFTQLYPILLRRRLHVTLFIYPSAISNAAYALTWKQLAAMLKSGLVDVQSHTYWHPDFRREQARRSPADYNNFVDFQLRRSRQVLEQRLGIHVTMLAWPYGIHDPQLERAARQAGYQFAFAFAGGLARPDSDPLAIPRIPVSGTVSLAGFAALVTREPKSP